MTCEEFLRRLDDGRDPADREAAEHARSCPACARALARWEAAQRELRAMSSEGAPPFLHARVMAHVRAETARRGPRLRLRFVRAALATAAVAVVAALAGYELLRQRNIPLPPLPAPGSTRSTALPPRAATAPQAKAGAGPGARLAAAPPARPAAPRVEAATPVRQAAPPAARNLVAAGPPVAASAPEGIAAIGESAPATSFDRQAADAAAAPAAMPGGAAATVQERRAAATGVAAVLQEAAPAAALACVLRATATGQTRLLDLPAAWAPPAGMEWTVTVGSDGAVAVADARGADVGRLRSGLRARLAALGLPPGRYLLTRRSG